MVQVIHDMIEQTRLYVNFLFLLFIFEDLFAQWDQETVIFK